MSEKKWKRRELLTQLGCFSASALVPRGTALHNTLPAASQDCELQVTSISAHTFRFSLLRIQNGALESIPYDGSLAKTDWGSPIFRGRGELPEKAIVSGDLRIFVKPRPLTISVATSQGERIQQLSLDEESGCVSFPTGTLPLLGLGEGGPQFDRRGSSDRMQSGQGAYRLRTHGGRVPIPWLIGTEGWALFFHQPFGTFDFSGSISRFIPAGPRTALPLDIFLVASRDPATIMSEYAQLTGHPEIPPLWSFGYQQSHRTLSSREEVLAEARTFRERKLPCDAMIYLGTGFCPSGWNTENGSFAWNSKIFDNPKEILGQLRRENFRTVLHAVILSDKLRGSVQDSCAVSQFDEEEAGCYWNAHRKDFALGVDGWWPDEGDSLDIASRLVRNRMYWEGPQMDRPNERPYALHRNGYAGMQRYASFLWSGDVYSTWETLKTHIPIAINTALTGIPYWGTDIGGFVPTKEFTAELFVRWFQFGAFCPLFRSHGRTWKLRLPWGWNTGDAGPVEIRNYDGAAVPDPSQLHNAQVEPICRKYLELRYRLLPYLYSMVHECAKTGMPILRALWLHYPDDARAVACSDEYLWGRSLLVAPVVERGATVRRVYLPRGDWYDFWTGEHFAGSREIACSVNLETMPLFAQAGSILPLGPVKQFTGESVEHPLSITVYPGANASFLLYEDDGISFNHREGEWMGIQMDWVDRERTLTLRLAPGSRMLGPSKRDLQVKLGRDTRSAIFEGKPITVRF